MHHTAHFLLDEHQDAVSRLEQKLRLHDLAFITIQWRRTPR